MRASDVRHLLADGTQATSYAEAAAAMVVLHATDPATVFLEGWARMADPSPESIEHELYEKPTVLRMLAMRRTLFIVPLPDVPMVLAAGSRDVAERERPRTLKILADAGIGARSRRRTSRSSRRSRWPPSASVARCRPPSCAGSIHGWPSG